MVVIKDENRAAKPRFVRSEAPRNLDFEHWSAGIAKRHPISPTTDTPTREFLYFLDSGITYIIYGNV